jgi:glucosamine--fructose-6-phosphate aminotransferase (isomerizing)
MCGILGVLGSTNIEKSIIVNGLKALQNRGYDSCGILTIDKYEKLFNIKKYVCDSTNAVDKLVKHIHNFPISRLILAHTRWATHGKKCSKNCHPHTSYDGEFALIHNGIIDNYLEIKEKLISHGIQFYSDTDTEVLVNLIAYYYKQFNNLNNVLEKITY